MARPMALITTNPATFRNSLGNWLKATSGMIYLLGGLSLAFLTWISFNFWITWQQIKKRY